MQLPTLTLLLSLTLSTLPTTLALPKPSSISTTTPTTGVPASTSPATPTLTPTGPEYHLRTRLVTNSTAARAAKAQYNDLCLAAYHTGAALNDAVAYPGTEYCIKGFLNQTAETGESYQEFDLGNYWPYGIEMLYEPYAAWSPVRINAGQGMSGLTMAPEGLVFNGSEFGGWMVCDWWHGDVQLFWKSAYYNYTIPSSCADVYLVPTRLTAGGYLW